MFAGSLFIPETDPHRGNELKESLEISYKVENLLRTKTREVLELMVQDGRWDFVGLSPRAIIQLYCEKDHSPEVEYAYGKVLMQTCVEIEHLAIFALNGLYGAVLERDTPEIQNILPEVKALRKIPAALRVYSDSKIGSEISLSQAQSEIFDSTLPQIAIDPSDLEVIFVREEDCWDLAARFKNFTYSRNLHMVGSTVMRIFKDQIQSKDGEYNYNYFQFLIHNNLLHFC
jgi:hypothetical protein